MTEQKAPQEIDLIELFSNIGKWFSKWFSVIFFGILYFLLRNIILFIIVVIAGVALAFIQSKITKEYFRSECIAYSHTISNLEVIRYINNWDYNSEFSESEIENIKTIAATYLLDVNKDGIYDMVEEPSKLPVTDTNILKQRLYGNFCLVVEVYDTTLINKIQEKAFQFLSNNKRVKDQNEIRLRQLNELLPKYDKEITDLDSLKRQNYFEKAEDKQRDKGSLLIWNEKEVKLLHSDILALYKQKQGVERELFLNEEPYEIILDFSVPKEAENSFIVLLIKYLPIFFLLGFLLILLYDQRRLVRTLMNNSKKKAAN